MHILIAFTQPLGPRMYGKSIVTEELILKTVTCRTQVHEWLET